jgi:hypothetical protein
VSFYIPADCVNIGSLEGAKKPIVHGRHTAMRSAKLLDCLGMLAALDPMKKNFPRPKEVCGRSVPLSAAGMGRNASASAKEALAAQLNELSKRTCNYYH